MITLEQHLAAHALYYNEDEWRTSPWVCKCKWTPTFDPDDEFFEGLDDDSITGQHAAHVAATWREARTVRTVEELDALPENSIFRVDGDVLTEDAALADGGSFVGMYRVGKKAAGRELDRRTHDEYPNRENQP